MQNPSYLRAAVLAVLLVISQAVMSQKIPQPYSLFTSTGKATKYKKILKAAKDADVIFFGELHNNALGHWLQNRLARDLGAMDDRPFALGLEMFETDQQAALDQYLAGEIEAEALNEVGEGLWNNFTNDYEPLVKWFHKNKAGVVATNVPRKYARVVFKQGFEGLKEFPDAIGTEFPSLPVPYDPELKAYKEMLDMMGGNHGGETFPMAQAIKDATMAWRITETIPDNGRLLHLNGSFHSEFDQGIIWYLGQYRPALKILSISMVEQADLDTLSEENEGRAQFIFVIDELMTKTY